MGRKYITNQQDINYVYPNNIINQYDVDIVHDINNNCVAGTSLLNISGFTTTGMTVNINYSWNLNGAERMLNVNGTQTMILSLHGMIAPQNVYGNNQGYFNPWRMLYHITGTTSTTTQSGIVSTGVLTPAMFGLSAFTSNFYVFESRLISRNCVLPICSNFTLTL